MKLAVHSLFEFGAWDGDVLIITDGSHVGEVNDMFASLAGRVIVAAVPAADILDYTLARYKIVDLDIAARYQPLIYLDTDIICDAPLKDFLAAMAFSDALQVYPEALPISVKQDFFGTSLLTADGVGSGERDTGISSGVFAFSNPASQRDLFHRIIDIADKVTQSTGRSFFQFYDQPFFNYVLYKSKLDTGTGLSQIVDLYHNFRPALAAPVGKGLVHFAGGVGNATPKLVQMENYIKVLRQQQRKEVSSAF
jgi:lipopolysaccharide biosynthesis glycosyltransferase